MLDVGSENRGKKVTLKTTPESLEIDFNFGASL